jgi:protein-tyrosine-phosphatase
MAEAFAHMFGGPCVEAYSAGCRPAKAVHPKAIAAMRELGYDLTTHVPKGIAELPDVEYDMVIVMCGDAYPGVKYRRCESWSIPVPKFMPFDEFRMVRDQIGEKVQALLTRTAHPMPVGVP